MAIMKKGPRRRSYKKRRREPWLGFREFTNPFPFACSKSWCFVLMMAHGDLHLTRSSLYGILHPHLNAHRYQNPRHQALGKQQPIKQSPITLHTSFWRKPQHKQLFTHLIQGRVHLDGYNRLLINHLPIA